MATAYGSIPRTFHFSASGSSSGVNIDAIRLHTDGNPSDPSWKTSNGVEGASDPFLDEVEVVPEELYMIPPGLDERHKQPVRDLFPRLTQDRGFPSIGLQWRDPKHNWYYSDAQYKEMEQWMFNMGLK